MAADAGGDARRLEDLTLAELWQLFPIRLRDHDPQWSAYYAQESAALVQIFGVTAVRVSHIGSTVVPGLLAKPTVDILLELATEISADEVAERLARAGWLQMYGPDGEPLRCGFNKGYTPHGFAQRVFHLHVRRPGDPDELYFRDYLLEHPDICLAYAALKRDLARRFEYDRDAYTEAKTECVRDVTARARRLYGPRYPLPAPRAAGSHNDMRTP